jgi:excisionase family DNA binding protein
MSLVDEQANPAEVSEMTLIGKSRPEIEHLMRNKQRPELLDIIFELATVEPHFSVSQVARLRKLSRDTILAKIHSGAIPRVHKPVKNALRIPLSAVKEWDAQTMISNHPAPANGR